MSEAFRRAVVGTGLAHGQVAYGTHADQVSEVLTPDPPGDRPLVVVIHGGFWRAAYDRAHTAEQCVALARAGYAVAALEYRRVGGGGGWPTTFDDVAAGIDALPGLLSHLIDPARVVLVGHSAGGHLALWAAGRHRLPAGAPGHRPTPPPIRGVVSLAGVADLGWAVAADMGGGAATDLLGASPGRDPEGRWATADPAQLLPTGLRTICLHGGADPNVPVGCAAAYVAAARAAGDAAELRELPGVGHFEFIDPGSSAWPHVLDAVAHLAGPD